MDRSWALMLSVPGFKAPAWAHNAVIYQIFPDRFRNGRANNDPTTGDTRYADPVVKLPWGTLPEGYRRNYAGATANSCPWRFDTAATGLEQPRGRDYMGGDLRGVDQQLDYLHALGATTIYFNPIFDAGSNHGYDTQDYTRIDPYFGTQQDWANLVRHADQRGMRIILDGVFNHLSSDSPFFDRYHHYATVGACESATSPYRAWFLFQDVAPGTGTCVGSDGTANGATYTGWFGFDSIPVINKAASNTAVWKYFLTGNGAITTRWINAGASGWRLDVAGDASFPAGYWETFREVLKKADRNAIAISETWQKDSTLLREVRGDRFDTTMNYRLRDAVLGFLAPGAFDSKGFPDSGNVIPASAFLNRLASIREDYPDAAYYSAMNLLDSHDTARLLWTLTPGADTTADKEQNAANVAAGKARVRLASLIQFTQAGAPTIYYGDEVGVTGADDPDDRRTYPWADQGGKPTPRSSRGMRRSRGSGARCRPSPTATLRRSSPMTPTAWRRTAAPRPRRRRSSWSTATAAPIPVTVPLAGYLRDGLAFSTRLALGTGGSTGATSAGGSITVTVPANGALVLATSYADLRPAAAPLKLVAEGDASLDISWSRVWGRQVVRRLGQPGHRRRLRPRDRNPGHRHRSFHLAGLVNGQEAYVVVTANDAAGNRSDFSNEVNGLPHLAIGWANLQWPPTMTHTISAVTRTDTAYGQVWIDGVTSMSVHARTSRPAGLRAHGLEPEHQRSVDLARRRVQHRRRQQRRVQSLDAARDHGLLRLRVPLLHDRWPRLALRRPERADLRRCAAGQPRPPDRQRECGHHRARHPDGPRGHQRLARVHRARLGPRARRSDDVRLRGPALGHGHVLGRHRARHRSVVHGSGGGRGRHLAVPRRGGGPVVQPLRGVRGGDRHGGRAQGLGHVHAHRPGDHRRHRAHGVHRRHARPPRRRAAGLEPGRRGPVPRRRHALARHGDRRRGHPARVQVRARRLELRREGRGLRRDRQPPAYALVRERGTQAVDDVAENWRNISPCGN
ncbi:MAG: glycoside hydrolase family 13 protein [Chloroflexota bacterium]